MDAVDSALVEITGAHIRLLRYHETKYPPWLLAELESLITPGALVSVATIGSLHVTIGRVFATAVRELLELTGMAAHDVLALGSHGQTVVHSPNSNPSFTLQLGDPSAIAYGTGIKTVADFRAKDLAAGGQGAPLVPIFHQTFFSSAGLSTAIVNIGGIANVSLISEDETTPVRAFDTGPGNTLLDAWTRRHLGHQYDEGGAWAASGKPDEALLQALVADPYFDAPAPKSTGREYFNLEWLDTIIARDSTLRAVSPTDVQATLLLLTVMTIQMAIRRYLPACGRVLVCGGGAKNGALMHGLAHRFGIGTVSSTEEHGLAPEAVEAVAFAWLAHCRLDNKPGNLPYATGAKSAVILGGIYEPG